MKITVNKSDIKEYLDEEENCQLQIYADETYAVLPMGAYGYEGKIASFDIEYFDYEDCNYDFDYFIDWLNDGFYHVRNDEFNGIYIEITVA